LTEERFDFHGSMNDFLNGGDFRRRQANGERFPVGGPAGGVARDVNDLLFNARIGIQQFGRKEAFVMLVHPATKFRIEDYWMEGHGGFSLENVEKLPNSFEGCLLAPASFMEEGVYLIVGKFDYERLIEENPELL
jgi:hypothetical protein